MVETDSDAASHPHDLASDQTLTRLRSSIDNIDAALVLLLAERFKITRQVGEHKARSGLGVVDPERERQQFARLRDLAKSAGLDPAFSEKFLRFVIDEVVHEHTLASSRSQASDETQGQS